MTKLFNKTSWDLPFYKRMLILTFPIIIQNLVASLLNMSDTVIVGKLGQVELAAVGIANQYFFFFSLILFGINAGCSMFITQFWGKKDMKNIKKMTGISLVLGIIASVIFTLIAFVNANGIISLFNKDTQVVLLGSKYLIIVAISYVFTAISFTYAFASRSIENTFLPMMASIIALVINVFLNYVLVFGKFGFTAMGVSGSALATVIARVIETIIIILYVYKKKLPINVNLKDLKIVDSHFFKIAFGGIFPILINEIVWGLGNISYNIIYARISVAATATIQITTTIINLSMIVIIGLGSSSMIIVGKEIGRGDLEKGKIYAKRLCNLALSIGAVIGLIIFVIADKVVLFFNMPVEVLIASQIILKISSLILILRTYNFMMIVGILRGGGDAKFGVIMQGIVMWFIGIPLAYFVAFVLKLPIQYVVAFGIVEELIKIIFIAFRFNSGKWIKDITKNLNKTECATA